MISFEIENRLLVDENQKLKTQVEFLDNVNVREKDSYFVQSRELEKLTKRITLINVERHTWKRKYLDEFAEHEKTTENYMNAVEDKKQLWTALDQKNDEI